MTPGTSLVKCTVPKKVYNMVTTAESLLTHSKPQEQPHKTLSFPLAVKGLISRGEERFNPRLYTQIIPPPWYKRGCMEPIPGFFDVTLQYFETLLPLVESL